MRAWGHGIEGAADKGKGHATGVIVIEFLTFEHFPLVALAVLAGETRPFTANGQIEAITVVPAEHVTPNFFATLNGHIALRSFHDSLLRFGSMSFSIPK